MDEAYAKTVNSADAKPDVITLADPSAGDITITGSYQRGSILIYNFGQNICLCTYLLASTIPMKCTYSYRNGNFSMSPPVRRRLVW